MTELLKALALVAGCVTGCALVAVGWRIMRCDPAAYDRNRDLTRQAFHPASGAANPAWNGPREHLRTGLAVDLRRRVWAEQAALSEQALDDVLGPSPAKAKNS